MESNKSLDSVEKYVSIYLPFGTVFSYLQKPPDAVVHSSAAHIVAPETKVDEFIRSQNIY